MKKLILVSILALTAITATAQISSAAPITGSKYCEKATFDPLCMTDDMMKTRAEMMAMTKENAMANRTKYCQEHATDSDPICKPDMMNSTTGY